MKLKTVLCSIALSFFAAINGAFAQSTAFTYQGQLKTGGAASSGTYDLEFTVYDAATSGNIVGGPVTNAPTSISNGLFTAQLDFGANVFTGAERWLQIGIRTNGSVAPFTIVSPLQPVTSSPYAIQAAKANSVPGANITGTISTAQLPTSIVLTNSSGVDLKGAFNGDGGSLSNLNLNGFATTTRRFQTTVYSVPGTYTFTVPSNVQAMQVKLWGAGGHDNFNGNGGAGAFASRTLNVLSGETFTVVVGQAGNSNQTGGGAGSNNGAGGAGGGSGGGQASSLFKISGPMFIMKAVAGAGGGRGPHSYTQGGAGGNPGQDGQGSNLTSTAGGGGYNGVGGVSAGFAGGNYSTNAITIGETNLNLMGGKGGAGPAGGGGGYGGGGGSTGIAGAGGGGSYGDQIIGGNIGTPGNIADSDYVSNLGYPNIGGLAVVIFSGQQITSSNSIQATRFIGDGSMLSNVTASGVLAGITITNVTLTNSVFYGNGGGLTNITASGLLAGASITNATLTNSLFYGNGGGITNLKTTNLVGVLPTIQLPASVAQLGSNQTFTGQNGFTGASSFSSSNQTTFNGLYARPGAPGGNGVSNNGYSFGNGGDGDSGMYSLGDGQIQFYANNVLIETIAPGGVTVHSTLTTTGNATVNGHFDNTGNITSHGPLAGIYTDNREAPIDTWAMFASGGRLLFWNSAAANNKMSVDKSGNVRALGSFLASTTPDIAETISAASNVEAGDIVCADPLKRESVIRCAQGNKGVLGVISDGTSGFIINAYAESVDSPLTGKPLVLAGRVPVKVSLENGPVNIGDTLAPSSIPGVAMRATGFGPTVGVALDVFNTESPLVGEHYGTVLCFVKADQGNGLESEQQMREMLSERDARIEALEQSIAELKAAIQR